MVQGYVVPQNDARSLKLDPRTVTTNDFPEWGDLGDDKANRKLEEIKKGADLQERNPCLPDERPCQDACWSVCFLLTVAATVGAGYFYFDNLMEAADKHRADYDDLHADHSAKQLLEDISMRSMIYAGLLGAAGSTVAAFLFMMLAHRAPACVVWTSLFFGPVFNIVIGIALVGTAMSLGPDYSMLAVGGCVLIFLGVCMAFCIFFCYRSLIPFMIKLTEVVADVIESHPSMIVVALIGAFLGLVWTAVCFVAFFATYLEYEEAFYDQESIWSNDYVHKALYGFCVFVFTWGTQVVGNVCHVTYCGVFGRWYFQGERSGRLGPDSTNPITPSLTVAFKTSFGSICMGSFLIAIIRAVEAVVRQARRQAQGDGNAVMCIILMVLECIIGCIGDILEYFNAWAYVQCAIRGVSFCDAARITFSMIMCANLKYIISDLLLNSLVSCGSMLCAVVGGLCGLGAAFAMGGQLPMLAAGGICGLSVGVMAGAAALNVISSGVKTILMCWAEKPEKLGVSHPDIHQEFCDRIAGKRDQ